MIDIQTCEWQTAEQTLSRLRRHVFIDEQGVSEAEEWDGKDEQARHYILTCDDKAVACARLLTLPDHQAKIGRMAVTKTYRRRGLAQSLLQYIVNDARHLGIKELILDAQSYIIPLYLQQGFSLCSDEFIDAGIPHRRMQLTIS